jgi:hypothetical protein
MTSQRTLTPDPLRPTETDVLEAWARRVRAYRVQTERVRTTGERDDFYGPLARRFRRDPRRPDDAVLDALQAMTGSDDTWLDIGAGAGRYSLPLALRVRSVHAVEPSAAMLEQLRSGMVQHSIRNISITPDHWPLADPSAVSADYVLMAHVGYLTEEIGHFIDAAEAAADKGCIAVMRTGLRVNAASMFWLSIHGEERISLPGFQELLILLLARGRLPAVSLVESSLPTSESFDELLAVSRQHLRVAAGTAKDDQLAGLVRARAIERDGGWTLGASQYHVGIVSWHPRGSVMSS